MDNKIDDFGVKIGGAKKDLSKARTITNELLLNMNHRELLAFVKKDKIISKYDYTAMIESGISPAVALFIKKCRDAIPVQPVSSVALQNNSLIDVCINYVNCVKEFDEFLRNVRSEADAFNLFHDLLVNRGYLTKSNTSNNYYFSDKSCNSGINTYKLFQTFLLNSHSFSRLGREALKIDFGSKNKVGAKKIYSLYFNSYKNLYYVSKGRYVVSAGYASKDEASALVDSYNSKFGPSNRIKLVEPTLKSIERNGINVRNRVNIIGQDFLDVFKFNGGEFGNWLNTEDRQFALNYGFDAFLDLANILNIHTSSISFDGNLSIAFGSRGVPNAKAHYEPLRQVINLTKLHGAGSLGHEWFHSLDDYLSRRITSTSTDLLSNLPSGYILHSSLPNDVSSAFIELRNQLIYKRTIINGTSIGMPSEYMKNAIYLDNHVSGKNGHGYWQSSPELLARAFSCYLQDKMNFKSDYLESGHDNDYYIDLHGADFRPFIEGEERILANKAFDTFFDVLKRNNILSEGIDLAVLINRFEQTSTSSNLIDSRAGFADEAYIINQFSLDL